MKIKHKTPPNYEEIIKYFPWVAKRENVIFTYDGILYVPSGNKISLDLMAHEETHVKQQKEMGVKEWWDLYYIDPEFRLTQELEAYTNQYKYGVENYNRHYRRQLLKKVIEDLSGPLYGHIISKDKAKELITR